ncbi:FAD-dependent oxidoreductase [Desulfoluna sp.]|uniref:NAD(P)/FAD-dependent oxidoreductase n=1 Tax=Desulfoluna sp. TaxID=2045199 RepID=UPI002639DD8B|nr:FAD-dependent oxidoreductase [Desulfoluna sp.]
MKKKLLLLGGGHAHLETLAALETIQKRGHEVTVVAPSPHHYYSGMGPGMLGGTYTPESIRFDTEAMVTKRGARFVRGLAVAIDAGEKTVRLSSGELLDYDVLSNNVGSYVKSDLIVAPGSTVYSVKPIESLLTLKQALLNRCHEKVLQIAIAGGGPSSAEVAGNILQLVQNARGQRPVITLYSRSGFFDHFDEKIKTGVTNILEAKGIQRVEGDAVVRVDGPSIGLASGRQCPADFVISATGVRPSPLFADSHLPTGPDGGLLVNPFLQCTAHPEIFGGGDCIHFQEHPLNKVGVYAVRQNPILLHNLLAQLEDTPLTPFHPGGNYLLVFNLGEGTGYLHKNGIRFHGKIAFRIKDFIDRRFMTKYQRLM